MPRIEQLADEQIARFPEFIQKWTDIGLCTLPADRLRAERGIRLAYEISKQRTPLKIVWTTSPLAQGLTRAIVLGMRGKVGRAVGRSVRHSVRDSVWDSVRDSVGESVKRSVGESVRHSVRKSVGESVWDSVRDSVGDSVGHSVRKSVWESVRRSVGDSVGESVEESVWESVRRSVGRSVWESVKRSVGDSVGKSVGDSVGKSVGESCYGQHDANWLAFYEFFKDVCGLDKQTQALQGLWEVSRSAGWYLPHEYICWISERHHRVCRNSRGQIHSHDGMAVAYPDGWGVWAWNGVRVTEQLILRPETLTPENVAKEPNAQVRQVMVERIGIERVCQMFRAESVDTRGTYQLLILDLGDGRKRPYLKMLNPSVGVWHVEGVHPNCRTVQEALNWRNGLTPEQIDEINGADWVQQGDVILKPQGATKFKPQPIQLT